MAARATRTARISVALTPEAMDDLQACAAQLGVSPSAWAALRLGEAVQNQKRVQGVFESMGRDLATMISDHMVTDLDGGPDDAGE